VPPIVDDLLEYHSCTLLPALIRHAAGVSDESLPLERIESALRGSEFLATDCDSPNAADVCIGVDLLAYADIKSLPQCVSSFLEVRQAPQCCTMHTECTSRAARFVTVFACLCSYCPLFSSSLLGLYTMR
jgi:hypothetical protein